MVGKVAEPRIPSSRSEFEAVSSKTIYFPEFRSTVVIDMALFISLSLNLFSTNAFKG